MSHKPLLSHIFEEKKHGILIVAKSKHPSPSSSRGFDRKKLTYSHFAHTLSTTVRTVGRQKILHNLMCVWQIKTEDHTNRTVLTQWLKHSARVNNRKMGKRCWVQCAMWGSWVQFVVFSVQCAMWGCALSSVQCLVCSVQFVGRSWVHCAMLGGSKTLCKTLWQPPCINSTESHWWSSPSRCLRYSD